MIRTILITAPIVFTFPLWIHLALTWMVTGGEFLEALVGAK